MPGEEKVYKSVDCVPEKEGGGYRTDEEVSMGFLNSINVVGLPLHETRLRIEVPLILLRNLDIRNGFCNGTRLLIAKLGRLVLEAKIRVGEWQGNTVLIPRIALDYADPVTPGGLPGFNLLTSSWSARLPLRAFRSSGLIESAIRAPPTTVCDQARFRPHEK